MMNRLQLLFERLIGISQHESRLQAGDWPFFGETQRQFAALERPAYWRRTAKVAVRRYGR